MITEIPAITMPGWLAELDEKSMLSCRFPIREILQDSLYYPSCEFDGDPIKYLGGNIYSYIYVDFSTERTVQLSKIHGFAGYNVIASRDITERELTPKGWTPTMPVQEDGDFGNSIMYINSSPFAVWSVLQRCVHKSEIHGPARFSLLYICGEGAATFQALYVANKIAPRIISIIQPGYGFGNNWTNFCDPNQILGRSVLSNPGGKPDYFLYGGYYVEKEHLCYAWPDYNVLLHCFAKRGKGAIGLWGRA